MIEFSPRERRSAGEAWAEAADRVARQAGQRPGAGGRPLRRPAAVRRRRRAHLRAAPDDRGRLRRPGAVGQPPHVAKWWDENRTVDQIADYYGPAMRGEDPTRLLDLGGQRPLGRFLPGLPDLRPPRLRASRAATRRGRIRLRDRRGGARRPRSRHQPAVGVPARHRRAGVRRGHRAVRRPRPPQRAVVAGAGQARGRRAGCGSTSRRDGRVDTVVGCSIDVRRVLASA